MLGIWHGHEKKGDAYVLVVHTVVTRPVVDGALVSHGVDEHHEDANGPVRVIGTVRPQAVYASGDAEPAATSAGTIGITNRDSHRGRGENRENRGIFDFS